MRFCYFAGTVLLVTEVATELETSGLRVCGSDVVVHTSRHLHTWARTSATSSGASVVGGVRGWDEGGLSGCH